MTDQKNTQRTKKRSHDACDIVIIGNGIAGLTAAVEARRLAPQKRIAIITNQLHPTINTPALKQYAVAKLDREQLLAYPEGVESRERIHIAHANVEEIHARSKYLKLDGNRHLGYKKLLIATGSSPQGLPATVHGHDLDGVLTLHRLKDYQDLRRRLPEVKDAVVIGGGVHANETVMGLLYMGCRVHWLIRGQSFMGRVLDPTASDIVLEQTKKAGAIVYCQTEVTSVIGYMGSVAGVVTNQQQMIACQLILSCTGTSPVMSLAQSCSVPLTHKQGIHVDDKLQTNVPDIYAAGDVAAVLNPQTGRYELRAQWYSAVNMGRLAGASLTGETLDYTFGVPWHATHLGDLSMLTVGEPMSTAKNATTLTDMSAGGYRRLTVQDNRLLGYLSLGTRQPDSLALKQIIDEGYSIRDVKRDLLKGTLDVRTFLSNAHTRATYAFLAGRSPSILPPTIVQEETPSLPSVHSLKEERQTGPLVIRSPQRQGSPSGTNVKS